MTGFVKGQMYDYYAYEKPCGIEKRLHGLEMKKQVLRRQQREAAAGG